LEDATTLAALTGPAQQPKMPKKSKRIVRFANVLKSFAEITRQACMLEDLCDIARTHIRTMESEFVALKKSKRSKKKNTLKLRENGSIPTPAAEELHQDGGVQQEGAVIPLGDSMHHPTQRE
jgi:hypothetical protein